ncbi:MAG: RNA pyrophosphohydrolase [Wolbachia endosymbiont of Menacanthus eurysternus]|nr:MAG: RNA pyrophosphohydrolase [Wolbachia endosymbiont of Menacanthus eurysternus]
MVYQEDDKYRPCVGIMLFNKQGRIFVGKRFSNDSYWQMPQGGIDDSEKLKSAALRELLEEVGTNKVEIVTKSRNWIYYNLPRGFIPTYWNRKYFGQKQIWFLMKFCGEDKEININYTNCPEFIEWRWQNINALMTNAIFFRKKVYKIVIEEFYSQIKAFAFNK